MRYEEMKREIRSMLPPYYDEIKDFKELTKVQAEQLAKLDATMSDLAEQIFVDTATWGLDRWEEIFGIETEPNKPLEQRRAVIKAKIRGASVTTVELVKNVAESWHNGEVEVIEYDGGIVEIKFVSSLGVPDNLPDLQGSLREIIPAHLIIDYTFRFNTWDMIGQYTWDEVSTITWDEILTWEGE